MLAVVFSAKVVVQIRCRGEESLTAPIQLSPNAWVKRHTATVVPSGSVQFLTILAKGWPSSMASPSNRIGKLYGGLLEATYAGFRTQLGTRLYGTDGSDRDRGSVW